MKKYLFIGLIFVSPLYANDFTFEDHWKQMQNDYQRLCQQFMPQISELESLYMHPYWRAQRVNMAAIIEGNPDKNILLHGPISGPMVRSEWCRTQDYETVYLKYCLPESIKNQIKKFHEVPFGGLKIASTDFNCSINALGQLYFLTRIIECNESRSIQSIYEVGGGYGALAGIAKQIIADVTYVIFDLPEYLVLQSLYLRSTLENAEIHVHTAVPETLKAGAIHLVPIYLVNEWNFTTDIFISTAALSETPQAVQKMVIDKHFFNARSALLTGQLNNWGPTHNFEHQNHIFNAMRGDYSFCSARPLHHFGGPLNSYEIYGTKI